MWKNPTKDKEVYVEQGTGRGVLLADPFAVGCVKEKQLQS